MEAEDRERNHHRSSAQESCAVSAPKYGDCPEKKRSRIENTAMEIKALLHFQTYIKPPSGMFMRSQHFAPTQTW
jgi:hypothetical protein